MSTISACDRLEILIMLSYTDLFNLKETWTCKNVLDHEDPSFKRRDLILLISNLLSI